ncbi:MAG: tRNA uridine-5-carboxymethylaminomethyl(34) synthesis GTPase MnmE [Candidatus Avilachnospira sp.]|jgi:tRNA modification GTPase
MRETIAAIATGLTESGIGIVRISGSESYEIISRIFRTKSGKNIDLGESHRVHYGFIHNVSRETSGEKEDEIIDEVLVINMKAPRSYTGEDTIEIDCHGGVLMMKKIYEAVLEAGARPAEPGEFTKRAFLNGRIDLSQAEAVIDIINAKNNRALKASVSQLKGNISEKIRSFRNLLLEDTAYIEAALDDPEHISLEGFSEKLDADTDKILEATKKLIDSSENGKLIREGIDTVILGKPNAGKSSLLNVLIGEERAIVTDIAGTTRDTLEAGFNLSGITLNITDTAGIRDTEDKVEKIGIERALKAASEADLIIYVADSSVDLDESDIRIIDFINANDKKTIVLLNKSDLEPKIDENKLSSMLKRDAVILPLSAKLAVGIERLEKTIVDMFYSGDINYNDEIFLTSERQKAALINALNALKNVRSSLEAGMSEDFFTIDLMQAYEEFGYVIGEEVGEDLVDEIFSKFCMGK